MVQIVAVTGATGFVGSKLVARLGRSDYGLRVLSRRGAIAGAETISGALDDAAALKRLVDGARFVVHAAGLVKSCRIEDFARVNLLGTKHLAEAMAPDDGQLILISSLAARHPEVSAYAASKRAAEQVALEVLGADRVTIVRPPAVYGPGDRATLVIFRQLHRGLLIAPAPQGARFSLVHVDDLVALLADQLAGKLVLPPIFEPDDGQPGGYGWGDLATAAAQATKRRVRLVRVPVGLLALPARAADALGRRFGLDLPLSHDKLGELGHGQWLASSPPLPKARSHITFQKGFPLTLDWYRQAGWL